MINIDELRQRVEAAEQRFDLIDNSRKKASARLISMMNAIEQDQAQRQLQLEESKALISKMAAENQQLRGMLHSLLLAMEAAGGDQGAEILRQMDDKLTAMVETNNVAGDDGANKAPVEDVLPEPPGILPTAALGAVAPMMPEQLAEVEETETPDDGEDAGPEGTSKVREILERMNQEKLQKASAGAASSQT